MAIVSFCEFTEFKSTSINNIEKGALDAIRANSKQLPRDLYSDYTVCVCAFIVCLV